MRIVNLKAAAEDQRAAPLNIAFQALSSRDL
jgi:hypothetical protein